MSALSTLINSSPSTSYWYVDYNTLRNSPNYSEPNVNSAPVIFFFFYFVASEATKAAANYYWISSLFLIEALFSGGFLNI